MQEIFLLDDLLNVLIELESLGSLHYEKMAQMTERAELRSLFRSLSQQELTHKKIYEAYKAQKINFEGQLGDEEYRAYMDVLLKSTITFLNKNRCFEDFDAGYEIAIKLEKETLLFLSEMKQVLANEHHQDINTLMGEERKHLKFLLSYK